VLPVVAIALLLLVSAAGIIMKLRQEPGPLEPEDAGVLEPEDAGALAPEDAGALVLEDAGALAPDDGGRVDAPLAEEFREPSDAGELAASPPSQPDAGAASGPPVVERIPTTQIELFVTPEVDVSLKGRALGRTPLTVALPPGRHTLKLNNEEMGIRTARMIDVRLGDMQTYRIRLGTGSVLIIAPRGTHLTLDGREVGTAPVPEQSLFEGEHHLRATLGEATWEQSFWLAADKRWTFNVEFQAH
jgi:serine/threonine-protein kinase